MSELSPLHRASKARPCPVCNGDHKCSTTADGLILCGRSEGPVPGFDYLGQCDKDPQWGKYRAVGDRVAGRPADRLMPAAARTTSPPAPPPNLSALADEFARQLTPLRAADLAHRLGLPAEVLGRMPQLGYDPAENAWTFPEYDAAGFLTGLLRRFPDGSKRTVKDSHRGLSLVGGWADEPGPVFLVEGPTDTLALAAGRLSVVGRPSNTGGVELLANLLTHLDSSRMIVVVGENDRKPDGSWPGKDGARRTAEELALKLNRPVQVTLPAPGYKDVREWVTDRWQGAADAFDWPQLGADLSRDLVSHALTISPPASRKGDTTASFNGVAVARRKFPVAVPLEDLELPGPGGVSWVWDGFLARDAVTLFSALPKCGKTTLLAHLLAALRDGGTFCGRALTPGRALVVSEEPGGVWAARREEIGVPNHAVRVITRNRMARCGTLDQWEEFIADLAGQCAAGPTDLVVFDTLANLWPVRDENSAAEVGAALAPVHRLTPGRAVMLVHHLRKSDGAEGTGSRGSGALAGFVDIIVELRRQKPALDPGQRRRVLSGYGRYDAIPTEWVVELTDEAPDTSPTRQQGPRFVHRGEPAGSAAGARTDALRAAILAALTAAGEEGLTRKQLWEKLPEELRPGERAFREAVEGGVGEFWRKEERANRDGGPVYRAGGVA